MSSTGGVPKRARWAGLVLLALLPVAAAVAGCNGVKNQPDAPRQQVIGRRSKDYWWSLLRGRDAAWTWLDARCDVTIASPLIDTASKSVRFRGGRLVVQKPDRVYLRVPRSGDLRLLLAGDGGAFRAELPSFRESFSGTYADPVVPQPGRIHIMPADVAHAFCPWAILTGRVPVLTEGPRYSSLSVIEPVDDSETPDVAVTAAVTLDRATDAIWAIDKYQEQGGIRAVISYPHRTAVTLENDRSVSIPTGVLIAYPIEETRILLMLEDVKLDQPLEDEDLFAAGP